MADFVLTYNTVRLHSALGYVAPANKLLGRDKQIFAERDRKLATAREQRRISRQAAGEEKALAGYTITKSGGIWDTTSLEKMQS